MTEMPTLITPITRDGGVIVELVEIPQDGWLARNGACADGDASSLLGYARELRDGLDVVWLTPHPCSEQLPTLDEFIESALARCTTRRAA